MKKLLAIALVVCSTISAEARGFPWFFANIKPSGKCGGMREIAASHYWQGSRVATGERFNPHGITAASRTLPFGTRVRVVNPGNGRSITVIVNDRGPYGIAHSLGVKLDLSLGSARALGLTQTAWVCIS